jgi:hypothetical protein
VPANQITGLLPGEMFVHRNVANVVPPADLNSLSALQFAVDVLKVRHVIVCGHYGCAGVRAVLREERFGLVDNWLEPVREVRQKHAPHLAVLADDVRRFDRLCELNVIEQVASFGEAAWPTAPPSSRFPSGYAPAPLGSAGHRRSFFSSVSQITRMRQGESRSSPTHAKRVLSTVVWCVRWKCPKTQARGL